MEELKQHSEQAFTNTDYHAVFFAETHHGILHLDNNGQIIDSNDFMTDLTGYSRHELLDMSASELIDASFRWDKINIKAIVYGKSRSIFVQNKISHRRGAPIECRIDAKRIPYSLGKSFQHIVVHVYPAQKEIISDIPGLLLFLVKNKQARNASIIFIIILIISGNLPAIIALLSRAM